MVAGHLVAGQRAEQIAERWVTAQGYRIVARNYRCKMGELDLVAARHDQLLIIEVKYRRNASHGYAAEQVSTAKMKRIINATRHLLVNQPNYQNFSIRFDVIALDGDLDEEYRQQWIEAAFEAI